MEYTSADSASKQTHLYTNIGKTERVVSIAGAALLLLAGITDIKEHPTTAIMKLIGGGFLLFRGASGYCPVNQAIGRNTASQ